MILTADALISDKFIIINADDYYGSDAFKVAAEYLKSLPKNGKNLYANVAFKVVNTMSENGLVKRGVLYFDDNNKLKYIVESKL